MLSSPCLVKVLKKSFESEIISTCNPNWLEALLEFDFYGFEQNLYNSLLSLYDTICESVINYISESEDFIIAQRKKGSELALKKLETRPANIQLRTGTKISYSSLYAKSVPLSYEGQRHLSLLLWQCDKSSSPMYKSLSGLHSVLCPSFEVSKSLLNYHGIKANFDRVRQLSLRLGTQSMEQREQIQLSNGESLANKRVVIAIDGGRTRTKVYTNSTTEDSCKKPLNELENKRNQKFETPWREPKLFVISTIDEKGNINKERKPIYDCTFGDDEVFDLLKGYLKNLEIDKAKNVQFLADGAPWIWNRVTSMLVDLEVKKKNIIETLDYYHAIEHLNDMKIYMDKEKQGTHFEPLKNALWQGDFAEMTKLIKQSILGVKLEEFTPYKYFKKQQYRIDYQALKADNRPRGSGIIESGIRRIINLRFKSPSTFWYPENVEKLIFLRAIALAGRWEIMMNNLFSNKN